MLSIVNIKESNMNEEFYDPERSSNWGGYYQPLIEVAFSDGIQIVIEDTSCGEFGSRIEAYMYDADNNKIAKAIYGSMSSIYNWSSSFHRIPHGAYLDLIADALHYEVLESEELSDMIDELEAYEEPFKTPLYFLLS